MIRFVLGIIIFAGIFLHCHITQPLSPNRMVLNWKEIDSLEAIGKYQSAASACQTLYQSLPADSIANRTKAIIYLAKYTVYLDPEGQQSAIRWLDEQSKQTNGAVKSLIHSFTAQQIAAYADQNRWGREDILPGLTLDTSDLQTWPLIELYQWAKNHYDASIADDAATMIPLTSLGDLIVWDTLAQTYAPTLHYLLLDRALRFYQRPETQSLESDVVLDDLGAIQPLDAFLKWDVTGEDENAIVLRHFQRMLDYTQKHLSQALLLQTDLNRLEYAFNLLVNPEKENVFEETLMSMATNYSTLADRAWIRYKLANYFVHTKSYTTKEEHAALNRQGHELATALLKDFPQGPAAEAAKALLQELETVQCNVQVEGIWSPARPALVRLTYRNIKEVKLSLYALADLGSWAAMNSQERNAWLDHEKPLHQWTRSIQDPADYLEHTTEVPAPALEFGKYVLAIRTGNLQGQWIYADAIQVSDLIYQRNQSLPTSFLVASRTSGQPVDGAKGFLYKRDYDRNRRKSIKQLVGTIITNQEGEAITENMDFQEVTWTLGPDTLELYDGNGYRAYEGTIAQNLSVVLSDRSIYRPGQRMQLTVLFFQSDPRQRKALIDQPVEVHLVDANQQVVSSIQLRTNAYGSVSTSFLIPTDRLAGTWSIQTPGYQGYYGFQVEAYKRPTIDLTWIPDDAPHVLGDKITVTGQVHNLAGNPVQGATGKFTIYRRLPWFDYWRIPAFSRRQKMNSGTFIVDRNGRFSFVYDALPDPYASKASTHITYNFEVDVEVIDLNGETHPYHHVQSLSDQPVTVAMDPEQTLMDRSGTSFGWKLSNYEGQPQTLGGTYALIKLKSPDRLIRKRLWPAPELPVMDLNEFMRLFPSDAFAQEDNWHAWEAEQIIQNGSWQAKKDGSVSIAFDELPVGVYRMDVILENETNVIPGYIKVLSTHHPLPIPELLTVHADQLTYQPGERARLTIGAAWPDQNVCIRIQHGSGEMVKTFEKVNQWTNLEIPVQAADYGNIIIQVSATRANRNAIVTYVLPVPWTIKELAVSEIQYDTVVEPGQGLEWSARILDREGKPVKAEITSVLYDASLDLLNPHQWFLPDMPTRWSLSDPWRWRGDDMKWLPWINSPTYRTSGATAIPWFYLNDYQYPQFGGRILQAQMRDMVMKSEAPAGNAVPPAPEEETAEEVLESDDALRGNPATESGSTYKIRKNFDETAFFFPQMQCGADGKAQFSFTMPDAYTRWKWMVIAHTPQMATVVHTETLESRRDLMLFPNLPRVVRSGDVIEWPVKIVNTSNRDFPSSVTLGFFNGSNREPLLGLTDEPVKELFLKANSSEIVNWMVRVPEEFVGVLGSSILVNSGTKSDREERLVPVLTNKTRVIDTYPFYLNPGEEKVVKVDALSRILDDRELQLIDYKLEWTADPAWLVLPALTYVQGQRHLTATDWAESAYSWILGDRIVANPIIRQEIANWPVESLKSPLEDNEDLKEVVLRETPWILDAQSESGQMQQLKAFLEPNTVRYQIQHSLEQLQALQNADGGFSWCPQGRSDVWMTIYVMDILGRLHQQLAWQPRDLDWLSEALTFTEEQMEVFFRQDTRKEKTINSLQVKALAVLNQWSDVRKLSSNKWVDFTLNGLPKQWTDLSLQLQAYAGELLKTNHPEVANTILESLVERSLIHPELGRYWKDATGFDWETAPIQTQAAIIQFMRSMKVDPALIQTSIQWLLKNKQTNHWASGSATYAAIQAIWTGTDVLPVSSVPLSIQVGNWKSPVVIRGEQDWVPQAVTQNMAEVRTSNPGSQIAWGSVFVQSLQPLSAVEQHSQAGLSIQRVLSEVRENQIVPIEGPVHLAKGTRIRVRLILKTDRDLDYVYLKDLRGAGLEPVDQRSGYHWDRGFGYYQVVRDESQEFFMDHLRPGTHIIEFDAFVGQYGTYESGNALVQCLYAPAFAAHTAGVKLAVSPVQ